MLEIFVVILINPRNDVFDERSVLSYITRRRLCQRLRYFGTSLALKHYIPKTLTKMVESIR